ncbi:MULTISPECIES: hypothetical protein [unclassified Thioalkalivibrio]|uniref:hypothetical protein n=1 Tax=unclassified Thioalkalivibrio TaxID=2621013 RepID=UPI000379C84A|nr:MULTISPECIES: hypothetical protein [unclassified Thioalkalivibrio]
MSQVTARAILEQPRQLDESDRYNDQFSATYLFHHFLSEEDVAWLGQFSHLGLGEDEQRALIFVRETGRITNSDYRDLNRADTLTASQRLTHLRDLGLIDQVPRGAATYYVPSDDLGSPSNGDEGDLFSSLSTESGALSQESEGLSTESESLSRESLLGELPDSLRQTVQTLGRRSRDPARLESAILVLCALRPYSLQELAIITGRNPNYLRTHYVARLLEKRQLHRKYPDEPNRPDQAYIATEEQE